MANIDTLYTQLLEGLGSDPIKWQATWQTIGSAKNLDGIHYNGINALALAIHADKHSYTPIYGTYKAIQAKGLQVSKGAKSVSVVFFSTFEKEDAQGEITSGGFWKRYNVFSVDQCEEVEEGAKAQFEITKLEFIPNGEIESYIATLGVSIEHDGDRAYYTPTTNTITLPPQEQFKSIDEYYSTLFHELTHWTNTISPRKCANEYHTSDIARAKEELIAEIGSAILSRRFNLTPMLLDNHIAYVQSWARSLKDTPKEFHNAFSLANKALKALDLIADKELSKVA